MFESVPFWMWIVGFLLVLGPLVTVHELGHYLFGRMFGVKAEAFSIGFGKELWGRTDRRGTRWKIAALPLGGYVQFAGDMNPAGQPSEEWLALPEQERQQTFQAKPLWQRALIVAAGPVTNIVVAVAIFASFNLIYGKDVGTPIVAGFAEESPGRDAGLRIGDRIIEVDGEEVRNREDLLRKVAPYPDTSFVLTVARGGSEQELSVRAASAIMVDRFGNESKYGDLGVRLGLPGTPVVGGFVEGSPAEAAGVEVGDKIVRVDGRELASFDQLIDYVGPRPGEQITLTVERGGERRQVTLRTLSEVRIDDEGKRSRIGLIGVYGGTNSEVVPVGPVEAVTLALQQTWQTTTMMVDGIGQILVGDRSVEELGGPIKIAKFSGEQLSLGWTQFVYFAALISLNLAFINLLPIPALDGGHLAFYAAEAIRRKPASPRSQEWAFRTGIAFVLALMLFVTINDIASLPIFGG